MKRLWSERAKFERWLKVEIAVLQARADREEIPVDIPGIVKRNARINVRSITKHEEILHHDLNAFLAAVAENLPEEVLPYWHHGLTSYDIEDTALGIALSKSTILILQELEHVMRAVLTLAQKHKHDAQIGRTHGMHAEPISFGFKLLNWYEVLQRHQSLISQNSPHWKVGKISGAVGMHTHASIELEESVCRVLDLRPALISTQIISRERYTLYFSLLASLASSLEKFATDIRLMAQTEIGEVKEGRGAHQMGSSAMPHKSSWDFANPIKAENICALAPVMREYVGTALGNQITWHERDLTNSGNERMNFANASTLAHFLLRRFGNIMENLQVFPDRMRENIWSTGGAIFSQHVMVKLQEHGMSRQDAHKLVSVCVQQAEVDTISFKDLVLMPGGAFSERIPEEELEECFGLNDSLGNINTIFERVIRYKSPL